MIDQKASEATIAKMLAASRTTAWLGYPDGEPAVWDRNKDNEGSEGQGQRDADREDALSQLDALPPTRQKSAYAPAD